MCPLQGYERSVQNQKCGRCKSCEDSPLKTQCFPEHVPVAERAEPEEVHVTRQRSPTSQDDAGKDSENEKEAEAMPGRTRPRTNWRPVDGLGHCLPRLL